MPIEMTSRERVLTAARRSCSTPLPNQASPGTNGAAVAFGTARTIMLSIYILMNIKGMNKK